MKKTLIFLLILMSYISSCSSADQAKENSESNIKNANTGSYEGVRPITSCSGNYYNVGQNLEVDIFFNRKINHELKITFFDDFDFEIEMTEGKDYTIKGESIHLSKKNLLTSGRFVIKAKISIVDGDKELKSMDYQYEYSVGKPIAIILKENENELLLNEETSLNVSVAGYAPSEFHLTTNNGEIFKKDGKWIIRPDHQGDCIIKIIISANEEVEINEYVFKVIS